MTFNEQDHPRDEMGKFTFKNGGGEKNTNEKQTPAEILYGKKTKEEKRETDYKNILLSILGDKATSANILYGKTKDLEKIIRNNSLTNKLKKYLEKYKNSEYRKKQINPNNGDFGFSESKNNIIYYNYLSEDYNKELGDFLNKNTSNPYYYANDLRHQYVSALFARNLGEETAKFFGNLNEKANIQSIPGDEEIDQINNEIGRNYAKKYPNMPREELLKLVLKEHSKNQQIRIERMKKRNKNNLNKEYL